MAHHKLNYLDGSIKSFLRIHGYHGRKRPPSEHAKCVGQELRQRGSTGSRKEQQAALSEAARKCANQSPNVKGSGTL